MKVKSKKLLYALHYIFPRLPSTVHAELEVREKQELETHENGIEMYEDFEKSTTPRREMKEVRER